MGGREHSEHDTKNSTEGNREKSNPKSDGGTLTREGEESVEWNDVSEEERVEAGASELEVVVEEDPDQLYDTSGSAQRVIDDNFNVVSQGRVIRQDVRQAGNR